MILVEVQGIWCSSFITNLYWTPADLCNAMLALCRREYNRRVKEVVETSWMEEPDADDS